MSEASDPRAGETISIPLESSQAETVKIGSGDPESGTERAAGRGDAGPESKRRGPTVAETEVAASPRGPETVDIPSPSVGETVETSAAGDSKMTVGGCSTDPGSGGIEVATSDETVHAGSPTPVSARSGRSRPDGLAVPGYQIVAEIGRGGMGVVYKARHVRLDRLVALKMILAGAHASADEIARFHIEARAVARIQHPGIVQIHEDGDHDGLPILFPGICPRG